jgi:hypothetical protein
MSEQIPDYRTQEELLHTLEHGAPDEQDVALARLADVGDAEALDAVIAHLRARLPHISRAGLRVLEVLANKFAPIDRYSLTELLIPSLEMGDWNQRLAIVRLLATHPNELAVDNLRQLIAEVRQEIENTRLRPARPFAEPTLNALLAEAILAMAHCGHMNVLPDITEFLEDPPLRPVAVQALGIIGTDSDRPQLEEYAEDDDVHVRDAAQWALGMMDDRLAQLMAGPEGWPEPPPDRLLPVYWTHRQLFATDDPLVQFLVTRIAIEHLLLDRFFFERRNPRMCVITARRFPDEEALQAAPPREEGERVGGWLYRGDIPSLEPYDGPDRPGPMRREKGAPSWVSWRPSIVIRYPATLEGRGYGMVICERHLFPLPMPRWEYYLRREEDKWEFYCYRAD